VAGRYEGPCGAHANKVHPVGYYAVKLFALPAFHNPTQLPMTEPACDVGHDNLVLRMQQMGPGKVTTVEGEPGRDCPT